MRAAEQVGYAWRRASGFSLCRTHSEFALKFSCHREMLPKTWSLHYFSSLTFLSYFQMKLYRSALANFSNSLLICLFMVGNKRNLGFVFFLSPKKKENSAADGGRYGKLGACHLPLCFPHLTCYPRTPLVCCATQDLRKSGANVLQNKTDLPSR